MSNTDLSRLLNSDEIRKVLRAPQKKVIRRVHRLNPLTNTKAMLRLNPYSAVLKREAILATRKCRLARDGELAKKRAITLPANSPSVRAAKLLKSTKEFIAKAKTAKPKVKKQTKSKKAAPAPAPAKI